MGMIDSDKDECRLYDSNPTKVSIAMSRAMWPEFPVDLRLGLRVDAIDQRGHWFSGSVVEITPNPSDDKALRIKVHFDNFSSKWDLKYSFNDILVGNIQPLHSHT